MRVADLRSSSGNVGVVSVVIFRPEAVAEERRAAAQGQEGCGEAEHGVSDADSAFLDGSLGTEPTLLGDGDVEQSTEAVCILCAQKWRLSGEEGGDGS